MNMKDFGKLLDVSQISIWMGDTPQTMSDSELVWAHETVRVNSNGSILYALSLDIEKKTMCVDADLPNELMYQLWGYGAYHKYKVTETWAWLEGDDD